MTGILVENVLGVIQNKDDLMFIIMGHSFYLNPQQGKAQWLHLPTAQPYQWNVVPVGIPGVVQL